MISLLVTGISIGWTLNQYRSWTGAAYSRYRHAYFDVES